MKNTTRKEKSGKSKEKGGINMKFNLKNSDGAIDIKQAISNYSILADVSFEGKTYIGIKLQISVRNGYEHQLLLSGYINNTYVHICVCDKSREYGDSRVEIKENREIADYLYKICPESLASEFTTSHSANWED